MRRMARSAGGNWLRAASALATPMLPCDACSAATACRAFLCRCNLRTRAAAATSANAGYRRRCARHCRRSDSCVQVIHNCWLFAAQPSATVHGDGSNDCSRALQRAVDTAVPYSTIHVTGGFIFKDDDSLRPWKPVRLVGRPSAHFSMHRCTLIAMGELVMLENVSVCGLDPGPEGFHDDDGGPHDYEEVLGPAIEVFGMMSRLIAHKVRANAWSGSAVMLSPGSCAVLTSCDISSYHNGYDYLACLGVIAKSRTQLSMYACEVHDARWGVFAGEGASVLLQYNTFWDNGEFSHGGPNREGDISDAAHYPDLTGQVVQPWHRAALL